MKAVHTEGRGITMEYESGEKALMIYDLTANLKTLNRDEIREVLAELPPTTLRAIYETLIDLMA